MEKGEVAPAKEHRASRKKGKKKGNASKQAVAKPGALARRIRLAADRSEKRQKNPTAPVDRSGGDAAPRLVAVVGPAGVGKSTIIRNLVKHYTKRKLPSVVGPVTLAAGSKRRLTFVEVSNDLSSMIDVAKVADLVLLVIDASYGFEMETFEFLTISMAHGMPKVIGVLTHLDNIREGKAVRKVKKRMKDRFWAELYDGAKLFYLSGLTTSGDYLKREVLNLARFISVTKYAHIRWRAEHPYVLADRIEDITDKSLPDTEDRRIAAFGYIRGTPLRLLADGWRVHVPGVGDLSATDVEVLPDPCPSADTVANEAKDGEKRRKITAREKVVYAPMAPQLDGISYDRDAVYIDLSRENIRFSKKKDLFNAGAGEADPDEESSDGEGEIMVKELQETDKHMDETLAGASLRLVKGGKKIVSEKFDDGRVRRKVVFPGSAEAADEEAEAVAMVDEEEEANGDDSDESGEESENDAGEKHGDADEEVAENGESDESDSEDSDEDSEDSEDSDDNERTAAIWKRNMLDSTNSRLSGMLASKALAKHIYGADDDEADEAGSEEKDEANDSKSNEMDGIDDFFRPKRPRVRDNGGAKAMFKFPYTALDDMARPRPDTARDWANDEVLCKRLRLYRFGTGTSELIAATTAADESEEIVDGDFEDLETGEVHKAANNDDDSDMDEDAKMEEIRKKKLLKKQRFDAAWDQGETRANDDEDEQRNETGGRPTTGSRAAARYETDQQPDFRKQEQERLDALRAAELAGLDDEARQALEGISPGRYVRLVLEGVPTEFMRHFNPHRPVVVGGLTPSDEGETMIRARVRRHRFRRGVLKSNDPAVLSMGWRRFQTLPVFDTEDQGGRKRYLKYTPEFLHCNATFYAPKASPGTSIVMCQSLGRQRIGFRIAGTGFITEVGTDFEVVKKLKLVGEAYQVHRNTAFIKGMFNSELEVSKYLGASIRTVSGIRGSIKKAMSERARGVGDGSTVHRHSGAFRATFEDKILLSDIVFLRAWVPVEPQKFCTTATTMLDESEDAWRIRTTREVREALALPIPTAKDSLYKEVERSDPKLDKVRIPRALQAALPYASKPKNFAPVVKPRAAADERKRATFEERQLTLQPEERKARKFMQAVHSIRAERDRKRKSDKKRSREKREREVKKAGEMHAVATRAHKKRKFALEGARDSKAKRET